METVKTKYVINEKAASAFQKVFSDGFKEGSLIAAGEDDDASFFLFQWADKCEHDVKSVEHILTEYYNDEENKEKPKMQNVMHYVTWWHSHYLFLRWLKELDTNNLPT